MAEKLKGKKLNLKNTDSDINLKEKDIVDIKESDLLDDKFKIKSRKIKKPRKRGISFTQAINVSKIKEESEKQNLKIRGKKINERVMEECSEVTDNELETEETISLAVILFILLICFVVGIILGYLLYHIAINSSNALLIVKTLFY